MNDILAEHAAHLRSPENVAKLIVDLCNAEKRIRELETDRDRLYLDVMNAVSRAEELKADLGFARALLRERKDRDAGSLGSGPTENVENGCSSAQREANEHLD